MRAKSVNEEVRFEKGQDPKEALGIGGEDKKLIVKGIDAFTHWLYYVDADDMLQKVWNGWDHMREKLEEKSAKAGYLDPNSLMKFVRDLDSGNQRKLYDYIIKNHSDKW